MKGQSGAPWYLLMGHLCLYVCLPYNFVCFLAMTITRHCSECQGDSSGKNRETLPPRDSHLVISSPLTRCLVSMVSVMLRTEKQERGWEWSTVFSIGGSDTSPTRWLLSEDLKEVRTQAWGIVERRPGSRGKQWRFWSECARSGARIGMGTGAGPGDQQTFPARTLICPWGLEDTRSDFFLCSVRPDGYRSHR